MKIKSGSLENDTIHSSPEATVKIRFRNVGQGDTIFLESFHDGVLYLAIIDCKIDEYAENAAITYLRYLEYKKIKFKITIVVLSHPHRDHYDGAIQLFQFLKDHEIHIGTYAHTYTCDYRFPLLPAYSKTTIARINMAIDEYCKAGLCDDPDGVDIGNGYPLPLHSQFEIRCYSPSLHEKKLYRTNTQARLDQDNEPYSADANLLSTIIAIKSKNRYSLLTSDATMDTFNRLMQNPVVNLQSSELLGIQVPHHGSRNNFNLEFWKALKKCGNCVAVISVGKNKYGHPSPCVTKQLQDLDFKVCETNNYPSEEVRRANLKYDENSDLIDAGENDLIIEVPLVV
jgi:beta-lactamase superfamily II metal-dependent hydrolase